MAYETVSWLICDECGESLTRSESNASYLRREAVQKDGWTCDEKGDRCGDCGEPVEAVARSD